MTKGLIHLSREDAEAGCREPFLDAELYDQEYRHRRTDINFYRRLARNRMEFAKGLILDLACGSGRLLLPLVRDGHTVVGLDYSAEMLAAASRRMRRLSPSRRRQCLLVRSDLRSYAVLTKATLAIAAFHSVQHLLTDDDLTSFLRATRASLIRGAWLAFDVLPPDPAWLARDSKRRWGRTILTHPNTKQRMVYTNNHTFDADRRLLHMRLFYQPVDGKGEPSGPERLVRLCHRQLWPDEVARMLKSSGFRLLETFSSFEGHPLTHSLTDGGEVADEHVYVAVAV
jgi:SAM-dependent methyltransferase